jgi:hypothetical protein
MDGKERPCTREIPYIDVQGCTNALKDRKSEKGLYINAPMHPYTREIPYILYIKKPTDVGF